MNNDQTSSQARADLEATLSNFQDGLRGQLSDKRQTLATIGIVAVAVVTVLAYALGRRSGKRRSAIVDIRRL